MKFWAELANVSKIHSISANLTFNITRIWKKTTYDFVISVNNTAVKTQGLQPRKNQRDLPKQIDRAVLLRCVEEVEEHGAVALLRNLFFAIAVFVFSARRVEN